MSIRGGPAAARRWAARVRSTVGVRASSTSGQSRVLQAPRFNFKDIRARPEVYIDSIRERRMAPRIREYVPKILELYERRIEIEKRKNTEFLDRKDLHQAMDALRKSTADKQAVAGQRAELAGALSAVKKRLQTLEDDLRAVEVELEDLVEDVPNILSPTAPRNDEPRPIRILNPPTAETSSERPPAVRPGQKSHLEIGLERGLVDVETASRISGSKCYYLLNEAVQLELALVQYGLAVAARHGYRMMMPPSIVRTEIVRACGFRPRDGDSERQIYDVTADVDEGLSLAATAEIPMAGWGANKVFREQDAPIKWVGVSRSYRAEAGSRGSGAKGLYRVHEFTKVEMFAFAWPGAGEGAPDALSAGLHEEMREIQEEIIGGLGLCARVMEMPASDLGASAYKKYDIEAWMPGRTVGDVGGSWGEVTSTSNCLDFQARRMNTRVRAADGASLEFAHTLNGTAMAVPRVIAALLENGYDEATGRVAVPAVLQPYMGCASF
ncbi:uncharacterized protein V1510DRAFT_410511 [Dipodascopsis tothii]|uniref:uncharacterized protein n=1 Tax=Dipodascopsis tothii TaxID=44089 RepID=UPI0034CD35DD